MLVFALFVSLRERTLVFETVDGRAPRARAPGTQRRGILLLGALRCGQGRAPGMLSAAGGFRLFGLCDAAILSMAFGGISRGGTEAWPGEARDGSSHRYGRGYRPPAARCACAGKALRGRGADRGSPRTVLGPPRGGPRIRPAAPRSSLGRCACSGRYAAMGRCALEAWRLLGLDPESRPLPSWLRGFIP